MDINIASIAGNLRQPRQRHREEPVREKLPAAVGKLGRLLSALSVVLVAAGL